MLLQVGLNTQLHLPCEIRLPRSHTQGSGMPGIGPANVWLREDTEGMSILADVDRMLSMSTAYFYICGIAIL